MSRQSFTTFCAFFGGSRTLSAVGGTGTAPPVALAVTTLGSPVNLAQRMEANAPAGGILIAQRTHELLQGAMPTRSAGKIRVKGLDEPVDAYEVIDTVPDR